jgi:hypothetical protein
MPALWIRTVERAFRAGLAGVETVLSDEVKSDPAFALAGRAVQRGLPRDGACVRLAEHRNAAEGTTVVLRWLVEVIGANPDLRSEELDDRGDKVKFSPPIVDAARNNRIETVRYLVERGIETASGQRHFAIDRERPLHGSKATDGFCTSGRSPAGMA